ncbi:MAG: hypothetical protein RIE56_06725 [Amphiplicatus sp.]
MRLIAIAAAILLCAACGNADVAPAKDAAPTSPAGEMQASLSPETAGDPIVNTVWVMVPEDGRPGVMRVFLESGVLIQDSCWEAYRLSDWRRGVDSKIVWSEDGMDIEAEVDAVSDGAMTLRLFLGAEEKVETYRAAASPFVCPDMPR